MKAPFGFSGTDRTEMQLCLGLNSFKENPFLSNQREQNNLPAAQIKAHLAHIVSGYVESSIWLNLENCNGFINFYCSKNRKTFSDCQTIQQNPVLVETDKSKKRHLNCKWVLISQHASRSAVKIWLWRGGIIPVGLSHNIGFEVTIIWIKPTILKTTVYLKWKW